MCTYYTTAPDLTGFETGFAKPGLLYRELPHPTKNPVWLNRVEIFEPGLLYRVCYTGKYQTRFETGFAIPGITASDKKPGLVEPGLKYLNRVCYTGFGNGCSRYLNNAVYRHQYCYGDDRLSGKVELLIKYSKQPGANNTSNARGC